MHPMIDDIPPDYDAGPEPEVDLTPHDVVAERYVIGSALMSPKAFADAASIVTADEFYIPRHEIIWDALADFAGSGKPHEPTAILSALRDNGHLLKVGGANYLHDCIRDANNPLNVAHYASIVDALARRRKALTALRQATARLEAPGDPGDISDALAGVQDTIVDALTDHGSAAATTWAPVNLEPVFEGKELDPPPEILARSDGAIHLFYAGAIHAMSGEPESGKTWVTLMAAVQLITAAMPVVFIDFEDRPERVIARLVSLGATHAQIRDHFTYIRPDRALDAAARRDIAPHLTHAMLVIVDGVTEAMTVHGYDLNSNADAATFYGLLPRWIADHGPAVVMLDHVTKSTEHRGRYALGAQHKLAGLDGASYLVKVRQSFGRGKKGIASIDVTKDRPGHVREYARGHRIADFTVDDTTSAGVIATLDPPEDNRLEGDNTWAPTHLMEKISVYIRANPRVTQTQILEAIRGKKTAKREALDILVRRGYVTIEKGLRGASEHVHVRPFPDEDPDQPPLEESS